jgi:drug/metabolite transporter (DMT)-like permease
VGGHSSALIGVAALLLSSLCYGIANTFARGAFQDIPAVVAATGQMLLGGLFMAGPGIAAARAEHAVASPGAWAAVAALALLGTVGAYLLYYQLIARIGSTRTSSTTYLLPAFAAFYGAIFLHERLNLWILAGFALILLGVAAVNGRVRPLRGAEPAATVKAAGLGACD